MKKVITLIMLLFVLLTYSYADVPRVISYQGVLTDAGDKPISGGSPRTIEITIVNSLEVQHPSGFKFTDTYILQGGLFYAALGEQPKSNMSFPTLDGEWFLQINDKTSSTTYKVPLFSAPSALSIADNTVTSSKIKDGEVTRSKLAAGDENGQILVWKDGSWDLAVPPAGTVITSTEPVEYYAGNISLKGGNTDGQILIWNNGKWNIQSPPSGITISADEPIVYDGTSGKISLDAGVADGQILIWNNNKWNIQSPPSGVTISADEPIVYDGTTGKISLVIGTAGQVLAYDGSKWKPTTLTAMTAIDPLVIDNTNSIISIKGGTEGQALVWKNGAWVPSKISTVPIGTIQAFAGDWSGLTKAKLEDEGWKLCNGDTLNREDYRDLFGVIGISWGTGNGISSFNIPDIRGYFLRGANINGGVDPGDGRSTSTSTQGIGSIQGDQYKKHNHSINDPKHSHYSRWLNSTNPATYNGWIGSLGQISWTQSTDAAATNITINDSGTSNETRPKNVYVNYIIKAK